MYLNRKQRRAGNKRRDGVIKIVGHKLTAAGTLYDVISPKGISKKILHSTLMNTSPVEVANYQEKQDSIKTPTPNSEKKIKRPRWRRYKINPNKLGLFKMVPWNQANSNNQSRKKKLKLRF